MTMLFKKVKSHFKGPKNQDEVITAEPQGIDMPDLKGNDIPVNRLTYDIKSQ